MKKTNVLILICVLVLAVSSIASAGPNVKNIIVMISDGCGYNQLDAASIYQYGTTGVQVYEGFPFKWAMATYPGSSSSNPGEAIDGGYDPAVAWSDFAYVMSKPTDSAAAATAMACGEKTYNAAIGMDIKGNPLKNALQAAEEAGKSTGIVTSVQWSHATPAGFVAHNLNRNNYEAIAKEMVYNSAVDVIMGAGHPWFTDSGIKKSISNTYKYIGGESTWKDLTAGTAAGDADGDGIADVWTLIQTREDFRNLLAGETPKRVLGTAQVYSTLQQARAGDDKAAPYIVPLTETVPTLAEMTIGAINVLDNNPGGFCLMVEGGAIDWAAHANQSGRSIEEEIDFNRAVEAVVEWVKQNSNWGETLLIVTGDHETGYLTGSGSDPAWMPLTNNGKNMLPGMEWHSGDHTNSLIPFFAKGSAGRNFKNCVIGNDPVRGQYIDNTSIANVIFELLK